MSVQVFILTGISSWTAPPDVSSTNTIEAIGEGGAGNVNVNEGGAGGGAYCSISNFALVGNSSYTVQIGAGGQAKTTYFNSTSTLVADYGRSGISGNAAGGVITNNYPVNTGYGGGNGGTGSSGTGGGGGGGAGGPNGAGKNGGNWTTSVYSGGGGGCDGQSSTAGSNGTGSSGGTGGLGPAGTAGGAGSTTNGTAGTLGSGGGGGGSGTGGNGSTEQWWDSSHGPGSGGGGAWGGHGGTGGNYGGGGGGSDASAGPAAPGIIVVTYTPTTATTYTITAPSPATGNAGALSGNFTLNPTLGDWPNSVTITFSDGSQGGTFTPSSVSPVAGGYSPVTFQYTPVIAGTITITPSSSGAMTDPSGVTYTSYAANTYYFTGASSSVVNQTSGLIYLYPLDGVWQTGSITLSDGGGGGTFSSTTLTPILGTRTPVSFTYKNTSQGTYTITPSSSGVYTDPSALSFTVVSASLIVSNFSGILVNNNTLASFELGGVKAVGPFTVGYPAFSSVLGTASLGSLELGLPPNYSPPVITYLVGYISDWFGL